MAYSKQTVDNLKRYINILLQKAGLDEKYEIAGGPQISTLYKLRGKKLNHNNRLIKTKYHLAIKRKEGHQQYVLMFNLVDENHDSIQSVNEVIYDNITNVARQVTCEETGFSLIHILSEDLGKYAEDLGSSITSRIKSIDSKNKYIVDDLASKMPESVQSNNLLPQIYDMNIKKFIKADTSLRKIASNEVSEEDISNYNDQFQHTVVSLAADMISDNYDSILQSAKANDGYLSYKSLVKMFESYMQACIQSNQVEQGYYSLLVIAKSRLQAERDLTELLLTTLKNYADKVGHEYQEDVIHLDLDTCQFNSCIQFI